MIKAHYIYCALNFYYYYISPTSDHQALDPRSWGPLQAMSSVILNNLGGSLGIVFFLDEFIFLLQTHKERCGMVMGIIIPE